MKKTVLCESHVALDATLVDFAGWNMPVSYAGTSSEVAAVRSSAGMFDVSHMGEFLVLGSQSLEFLQMLTSNDVGRLAPGGAQYSLLLNEQGGVVDDIIVYRRDPSSYMIVVNAGCLEKDWAWLNAHSGDYEDLTLVDESEATSLIAVQGPRAVEIASRVLGTEYSSLRRFEFATGLFENQLISVSRTGYTGEDGFELFCDNQIAVRLWESFISHGVVPAGLGARDVLRLEAGYPLYGHELEEERSPYESGAGWAVKFSKPEFVGRSALSKRKGRDSATLSGIRMLTKAIPRQGCKVLEEHDRSEIGYVTSGTFSPTLQQGIAMVRFSRPGNESESTVIVDIRGRELGGAVVTLPFYRNGV